VNARDRRLLQNDWPRYAKEAAPAKCLALSSDCLNCIVTGFTGRSDSISPPDLPMRTLFVISLIGGALGALILLWTPPTVFARPCPDSQFWLIGTVPIASLCRSWPPIGLARSIIEMKTVLGRKI